MDKVDEQVQMLTAAVLDDPVLAARLKGVGVLTPQEVVDWGVVGPTARASGVDTDVRRDDPYAAYDELDWKVITDRDGDVFDKAVVRLLELTESISIVRQCLDRMPGGEINLGQQHVPRGEGIGRYEAPARRGHPLPAEQRHQHAGAAQGARAVVHERRVLQGLLHRRVDRGRRRSRSPRATRATRARSARPWCRASTASPTHTFQDLVRLSQRRTRALARDMGRRPLAHRSPRLDLG